MLWNRVINHLMTSCSDNVTRRFISFQLVMLHWDSLPFALIVKTDTDLILICKYHIFSTGYIDWLLQIGQVIIYSQKKNKTRSKYWKIHCMHILRKAIKFDSDLISFKYVKVVQVWKRLIWSVMIGFSNKLTTIYLNYKNNNFCVRIGYDRNTKCW